MSDTDPNILERLSEASKMKQEPKDRLWAAIYALVVIILLVGAIMVYYHETSMAFLREGRELAHERGAVGCMEVFIDDEWTEGLPAYCRDSDVYVHFSPKVCDRFLPDTPLCGSEWDGS
jgi:hypothetical protein